MKHLSRRPSALVRYGLGVMVGLVAIGAQWAIVPLVGARIPFMFLLIAIGIAAFSCGRGPAVLVLLAGALNASLQFAPFALYGVSVPQDRLAIGLFTLAGLAMTLAGSKARNLYDDSQQNLADIEQLHDVSLKLAWIPAISDQLDFILRRLAALHGTNQGLISFYDRGANTLEVAASLGLSPAAIETLQMLRGAEGAWGLACTENRRVTIVDTETSPSFAGFRALARAEGFRSVHSTPIYTREGEVLGAISLHFAQPHAPNQREQRLTEICARNIAVYVERARAESLARAGDQRLRHIVEASAIAFTVLSPVRDDSGAIIDFAWTYLNRAAAIAFQREPGELIGHRVADLLPGTWSEPGLFENYVAVALNAEVREFELRSSTNGTESWFQVVAYPLDGNVGVWFADVSDRKRQELELRAADQRKDEFLATLAHELRNPLAPIRQAALAAKRPGISPRQRDWCNDVIERQVQHMSLLLEDLMDVSRITRGSLQLRRQPTTLQSLLESALETCRPAVESRRHQLVVRTEAGETDLDVDPLRMAQVIANLVNNAAKYTPPGGVIQVDARVTGSTLSIIVTDNGIGIPASELESIFRMFSQVRTSQELAEGGLGIGLALTRGLVELHGGRVSAESAGEGRGSTFRIEIPDATLESHAESRAHRAPSRPVLSRSILVADDNRDAAESLALLLESDGHSVIVAHDGEEALRKFRESQPGIVLLDIGMPRLSGYEVARAIRAGETDSHALLVAITGWGQSHDRQKSAAAGFDHHVTKPVDYDVLSELISPFRPASARTARP